MWTSGLHKAFRAIWRSNIANKTSTSVGNSISRLNFKTQKNPRPYSPLFKKRCGKISQHLIQFSILFILASDEIVACIINSWGSWPLIYKKNFVCSQVLLNSLNVRTFAAAIKILLCCETFGRIYLPSWVQQLLHNWVKKTKHVNCTVWLISLLVIGWADLSFLRDCCLLEGGSGGERRKEDPHQARPQSLLVFQYGSRRHIGKRKDPGGEVAS